MGPQNAVTRVELMNATETVMRDEGYAAVTSRRVAERAGLNQQTVYYYFETMDDLLLATYQRFTDRITEKVEQALNSERPLHALWQSASDPVDAALTIEFMALANHNEIIRQSAIEFGERLRRTKSDQLSEYVGQNIPDAVATPPSGILMAMTSIAHILGFEGVIGLHGAHRETRMVIEWCLRQLEPVAGRGKKAPQRRAS
jgi:AcrR family transcriptional regulator